jgi:gamma-glutamyltranspeptidase / glutathione hydrolase
MKTSLTILLIFTTFVVCSQDRVSGKPWATRSVSMAQNGMAATSHPIATVIALDILKKGGSAVDAAIAANAFLGLADPGDGGMGGDMFAIVWDAKSGKLHGLNASGRSAQSLTVEKMKAEIEAGNRYGRGALSVTVPGVVDGWYALHEKFGKLPMSEIFQPTIDYARQGIPVTQEVVYSQHTYGKPFLEATDNPNFHALYMMNGEFPQEGDLFTNPDLANSMTIMATKGRDAFYIGEIADKIIAHIKERGGYLSKKDLATHSSTWVEPVSVNYRGYDVWEMPPNSQGIAALQMLTILEGYDIQSMGFGSADHIHHFLEAKKLAYEDMRMYYGDPEFGTIPIEELLSEEYAAKRRALIQPDEAGEYDPGLEIDGNTVYLTIADKEGNIISLIQSNAGHFGSGEVPPGLGFVLQNRGAGFTMKEGHINTYEPNKRPFHTIIPAFVTKDGQPFLSFGLKGGDMQTQGHVQMIMNIIDFGMNVQESGDAPRIYHRGGQGTGEVALETGFDFHVLRELMGRGHEVIYSSGAYGGYQAIMVKDGIYYGASEFREDGMAAGY